MTILAIGAHPDDIELGCGGTLARHIKEGKEVHILVLTCGESGGDPNIRVKESKKALRILGVKPATFGDLEDTLIRNSIREAIGLIEHHIMKHNPTRIYTHSNRDKHQDHIGTSIATKAACRNNLVSEIFMYESPATAADFSPQVYINIKDTLNLKIEALESHITQKSKHYISSEAVRGLAVFRGFQVNLKAAESFEVERVVYK